MGMEHTYEWRVSEPAERLSVHIESHRADADDAGAVFDATLSLRRRELSGRELARALARYPLLTHADPRAHLRPRAVAAAARRALLPAPADGQSAGEAEAVASWSRQASGGVGVSARARRARRRVARLGDRAARWLVLRVLARIGGGELELVELGEGGARVTRRRARSRRARCARCRDALAALLPPAAARQHRAVRVLHGRAVGVRRPGRADAHRGAERRRAGPPAPRAGAGADPGAALGAVAGAQHAGALAQADRRPLRPRQRAVRAVPGPHDDVLVRGVRAAAGERSRRRRWRSSSACARSSTCARRTICWRSAPAGAGSRCTRRSTTAAA